MVRSAMSLLLFTFLAMVWLLTMASSSEAAEEVVKNQSDGSSSAHFASDSVLLRKVKVIFNGGSEHRVEIRNVERGDGIAKGGRKYLRPTRVSPGGPDGHHHYFSKINDNDVVRKRT